jgi:competence protein ComGC
MESNKSNQEESKNTNTGKSPLDSLVSAGTITQAQADAIDNTFKALMENNKQGKDYTSNTKTNPLDSLVTAGTITQEQEDAIQSALTASMNLNRF